MGFTKNLGKNLGNHKIAFVNLLSKHNETPRVALSTRSADNIQILKISVIQHHVDTLSELSKTSIQLGRTRSEINLLNGLFCSNNNNKMLSYRRETALQGALVLAKSGRLELGDNILRTL